MSASINIAILSDTHGHMPESVLAAIGGQHVDAIIHAGDSESEYALSQLESIAPVFAVRGNCDWLSSLENLPHVVKRQFGNALLVVAHKPDDLHTALNLLDIPNFVDAPSKSRGQSGVPRFIVGIHGHTHLPVVQQDDRLVILCPGSPVEPRGDSRACIAFLVLAPDSSDVPPLVKFVNP